MYYGTCVSTIMQFLYSMYMYTFYSILTPSHPPHTHTHTHTRRWEGALAHSLKAYTAHKFILEIGSTQYSLRPTHLTLLANLRRRSLQAISDLAYNFFLSKNVQRALSVTNELLIPCMGLFGDAIAPGDEGILETIREKWCHCLNEPGLTSRELVWGVGGVFQILL